MNLNEYYKSLEKCVEPETLSQAYPFSTFIIYSENRMNLVHKLKDQDTLKIIFENDTEWAIKMSALVKIEDEDYLKKIVKGNYDNTFKKDCLDRIQDQCFLNDTCQLYFKEEDSDMLIYLINRIFVKSFLEDLKKTLIKKKVTDGKIFSAIRDQISKSSNAVSYIFD